MCNPVYFTPKRKHSVQVTNSGAEETEHLVRETSPFVSMFQIKWGPRKKDVGEKYCDKDRICVQSPMLSPDFASNRTC